MIPTRFKVGRRMSLVRTQLIQTCNGQVVWWRWRDPCQHVANKLGNSTFNGKPHHGPVRITFFQTGGLITGFG